MSASRRDFDRTKCMSFLIKYEKLLEKFDKIWNESKQHNQKRVWQWTCIQWKISKTKNQHKFSQ